MRFLPSIGYLSKYVEPLGVPGLENVRIYYFRFAIQNGMCAFVLLIMHAPAPVLYLHPLPPRPSSSHVYVPDPTLISLVPDPVLHLKDPVYHM